MSNLKDFFGLWKRESKSGTTYFTGKLNGFNLVAFLNSKQNDAGNRPYINIYRTDDTGEKSEIGRLWYHKAAGNKKAYMSGKIGDIDVIAFVNKLAGPENRQPAIRVYTRVEEPDEVARDPAPAPATAPKRAKKKTSGKAAKPDQNGDLPF